MAAIVMLCFSHHADPLTDSFLVIDRSPLIPTVHSAYAYGTVSRCSDIEYVAAGGVLVLGGMMGV